MLTLFSEGRSVSEPGTMLRSRNRLPSYPTLQQVQAVYPILICKGEKLVQSAHLNIFNSFSLQKDEVYLNLVMEYLPEMLYRVARHYNKSKQTIPILFIKVSIKCVSARKWPCAFYYICVCRKLGQCVHMNVYPGCCADFRNMIMALEVRITSLIPQCSGPTLV